jgi:DNA polymerase III epsilon subunit-like protein
MIHTLPYTSNDEILTSLRDATYPRDDNLVHTLPRVYTAIDLETTSLDTSKAKIIEIAAVKFTLSRNAENAWVYTEIDTRNMLINPGIDIPTDVVSITGITSAMVQHKEIWEAVRDRVHTFVAGTTIIGHNVLYDLDVLAHNGLDIRTYPTIDTFELSEILYQHITSLNL